MSGNWEQARSGNKGSNKVSRQGGIRSRQIHESETQFTSDRIGAKGSGAGKSGGKDPAWSEEQGVRGQKPKGRIQTSTRSQEPARVDARSLSK